MLAPIVKNIVISTHNWLGSALGNDSVPCYFHDELLLFLIISVDDLKLSGPEKTIKEGCVLLRRGLVLELESRIGDKELVYRGCAQQ